MSDDESLVFLVCLVIALWGGVRFLVNIATIRIPGNRPNPLPPVFAGIWTAIGGTLLVLVTFGAHDVRRNAAYVFFYLVMALACLKVCTVLIRFLGISFRDDCLERGNRAAALALAGVLAGSGACFAGGNIGEGPGWQVVVFSAGLALGGMFACWLMLNAFVPVADYITVDRDVASGIRAAGFFVAEGLVLGRAVAGDWHSAGETILDFVRYGFPALVVLAVAVLLEHRHSPTPARPLGRIVNNGLVPALMLLSLALLDLVLRGVPK